MTAGVLFALAALLLPSPPSTVAATYTSLEHALQSPDTATQLVLAENSPDVQHLDARLGTLGQLQVLRIQCMEALEDLPATIGNLTRLEQLVIDNGNGCVMNVALPESLGQLSNLKVLVLYGALDPRDGNAPVPPERIKRLPESLGRLERLEVLNLARNGLRTVPPQVAGLKNLRVLRLEYNDLATVPDFVGLLDNLQELSLSSNGKGLRLPDTLARLKGLKVELGNGSLSLREQDALRARFPEIVFSFDNEYDDAAANEDAAQP
ncbi:MAG: hypothetical protein BWK76_08420 [Desulfobulbaceae bacterium A2]|nr:MAG: hypothetical protein BWK76_08420 [Desulfobulbaceae bacterium A2]